MEKTVAKLNDILSAIQINLVESLALGELRTTLLPWLISGEIDVSKIAITQVNSDLIEVLTYWHREGIADCHVWRVDAEIRFGAPRLFCH